MDRVTVPEAARILGIKEANTDPARIAALLRAGAPAAAGAER